MGLGDRPTPHETGALFCRASFFPKRTPGRGSAGLSGAENPWRPQRLSASALRMPLVNDYCAVISMIIRR